MKPRLRSHDPFANAFARATQPAANDAESRAPAPVVSVAGARSVLETRYPGMARAITLMWGYPELNAYFDRFWLADGTQTPVDPDAMSELMLLARIHQSLVPQRPSRSLSSIYGTAYADNRRDLWEDVPRRR